ncbi:hypothetical protein QE152_g4759 [Popillia japonica]|uniref:DUF4371 domain-containing protein n=1 Tax=Popillia japonica TaxID=7064 RepID=A0AAW1N0A0_POPJA
MSESESAENVIDNGGCTGNGGGSTNTTGAAKVFSSTKLKIKFFDDSCENGKVCDRLLELITVDAKSATAEKLYEAFMTCLKSKNIPAKNVIGYASDNASVMVGKSNSFMTTLSAATDALIVLSYICHSSALVASHACSKLPLTAEEILQTVANYFSMSAKRTAGLAEMQEFFKMEQRKMIKLAPTRWLSMHHASRYLTNLAINCKNPRRFMDLNSINLGPSCNLFLAACVPENIQLSLRKSCLEFLITAASEIQTRFPLNDTFFDGLKFLNPTIAVNIVKPENIKSLACVWEKFENVKEIDGGQIDTEWNNIARNFLADEIQRKNFVV